MLRKAIVAVMMVAFVQALAFPRGKQELVFSDDAVYDALAALSMEQGMAGVSLQRPLSVAEIDAVVAQYDYDSLSDAGKALYSLVMEWRRGNGFELGFGLFSLGTSPAVSVEGYLRSDTSIPFLYGYHDRKSLLSLPVTINAGDWVSIGTVIRAGEFNTAAFQPDVFINIPLNAGQVRDSFPHQAYAGTGFSFAPGYGVSAQIAQTGLSVGRTLLGSIIWNDTATEVPYANVALYAPSFRYDLNVAQLGVDRYWYTHRLQFRFFRKVQLGFSESLLVHAPLELRYLNPLIIFHTFTPWAAYGDTTCNTMSLSVSYTPVRYLRVYGLFVQDEWQFPGEAGSDDVTPNAMGFQLGVESYVPAGKGYVHSWAEGSYAQPFLYLKDTPNASMVKTYTEQAVGSHTFYEWIGSPFGPDTAALSVSVAYEVPGSWSVALSYLFAARGEYAGDAVFRNTGWGGSNLDFDRDTDDWPFPRRGDADGKEKQAYVAPHGIVEYENRLTVRAGWHPAKWLLVMAQPSLVLIGNQNHETGRNAVGFECALSVQAELSKLWKPRALNVD